MIAIRTFLFPGLLAAMGFAAPAHAADAAVEKRLEALGMKPSTDEDGDYRVVYDYSGEGRTQLVYVAGRTLLVKGQEVRKIFSPAAVLSAGKVTGEVALELLGESGSSAYGGWEVRSGVLFYAIEVPEPLTAAQLKTAMDICAELADNKELELSGDDAL